ncbi:hypothetical protein BDZ85DRAFT_267499 [Elsinoe ampelina]|uniref:Killer toxin Kp4 domain-containing protein n=1 Tax=Elsinoe ampelina TaxID=302913 RepID=A0A6A6G3Y9_9PEZI|nr:hypothetical protein BDZ85DRAFT_267499 [Elsinoe ampelina]
MHFSFILTAFLPLTLAVNLIYEGDCPAGAACTDIQRNAVKKALWDDCKQYSNMRNPLGGRFEADNHHFKMVCRCVEGKGAPKEASKDIKDAGTVSMKVFGGKGAGCV